MTVKEVVGSSKCKDYVKLASDVLLEQMIEKIDTLNDKVNELERILVDLTKEVAYLERSNSNLAEWNLR